MGNEAIVRAWLASDTRHEAFDKFSDAVRSLLHEGRFSKSRLFALMRRVDEAERVLLREDVERIAARSIFLFDTLDGGRVPVHVDLFGIPISGDIANIRTLTALDETFDVLTRAPKNAGFSAEDTTVCLIPVPLSLESLAMMSPSDLHDICLRAARFSTCAPDAEDFAQLWQELVSGVEKMAPPGDLERDDPDQIDLGVRALLGVRLAPVLGDKDELESEVEDDFENDREDDYKDALAVMQGAMTDAAAEEILDRATDLWLDEMEAVTSDVNAVVAPPVPWADLRQDMFQIHVDTGISAALAVHDAHNNMGEVCLDLALGPRDLRIAVILRGEVLTNIVVDVAVISGIEEACLDALTDRYRVRVNDDAPQPPRLH